MQLVLKACNNLYWFSSIFSLEIAATYVIYFFKGSALASSHKDQTGDKSEGTSPCTQQKDDDKGAKDDDKTSKDDDKASKDDGNNRDDGKQGKHTIFIGPTTILYFLGPLGTWIFVVFGKLCWISNNLYLFFRHDSSTCAPPPAARIGGKAASGTCCNLRSEGAARKSCSCSGAEF